MTRLRVLLTIVTIFVVGGLGTLVSLYARGYRFDRDTLRFQPSGLLVIKSEPDGAQVFLNGELKIATNATISLPPDTYDVEVRKEGYLSWRKRLTIEKEEVTEATANLFRAVPSLSAVTFSAVLNPVISDDLTKIAYEVAPTSNGNQDAIGLWVIETVNLPLGFSRDPRRVADGSLADSSWQWSPDGRQILLTSPRGVFLLDAGSFTPQTQRVNISSRKEEVLAEWEEERKLKKEAQIRNLKPPLDEIMTRRVSLMLFSPDENMILYTASSSANLPENIIKPIPGASTQKQERNIKPGKTYVYDIKEDRNFLIDDDSAFLAIGSGQGEEIKRRITWFPTSRQLVLSETDRVVIMDYDGTNRQVVYSGSYISPHAYPSASTDRLLVLTNLGANSTLPNIYSLSIK